MGGGGGRGRGKGLGERGTGGQGRTRGGRFRGGTPRGRRRGRRQGPPGVGVGVGGKDPGGNPGVGGLGGETQGWEENYWAYFVMASEYWGRGKRMGTGVGGGRGMGCEGEVLGRFCISVCYRGEGGRIQGVEW